MATKRKRGRAWEYVIKRKGLLERPLSLTFADEAEGDGYVARLEKMLDAGIVPPEFQQKVDVPRTIQAAARIYARNVSISDADQRILIMLEDRIGSAMISQLDFPWVETFVSQEKQVRHLSPSTIRHHVGALSRMCDWLVRKGYLAVNPFRILPRGYASYTAADGAVLVALGEEDAERDRRLHPGEEKKILAIMGGAKPDGRQRPLQMIHQEKQLLLFGLALETGMRLREMYTLTMDQVSLDECTVFLERTKNGNKRQVPLSSVAVAMLAGHVTGAGKLFPWWDGKLTQDSLRRTTSRLSRQFGRIFAAAGCVDLNFHDLRHEATCRFYERTTLSDVEIAKILGWKSLKMAMRYANLRGSSLAGKLW